MKSDNTWDLGTEGGQQRLLIPTAGVTAAYAEKAHKVTPNASSDIFARRSKLQTLTTRSRFFFASTISMLWVRRTRLPVRSEKCAVFFPLLASTADRPSRLSKEIRFSSRLGARCSKHFHSRNDKSSATIIPVPLSTAQECVDRTNLQATITNESREAAPRPRHHGVFRTRTHIRASSLPKMSAGIRNPCASINQPARALALGTDRPAHAGQRNNHYVEAVWASP